MIPAPPAQPVRFNAPPTWTVPAGFDPRRGHLMDPAWPAAPDGWAFWVTDAAAAVSQSGVPTTVLPRGRLEGGERRKLFLVLGVIAVVVGLVVWAGISGKDDSPTSGVGSCWTGGVWVEPVSCGSSEAAYIVQSEVASPDQCTSSEGGYLEDGDSIYCLRPLD